MEKAREQNLDELAQKMKELNAGGIEIAVAYLEGMIANEERHRRMKEEEKRPA